jgi:hypothetical protein
MANHTKPFGMRYYTSYNAVPGLKIQKLLCFWYCTFLDTFNAIAVLVTCPQTQGHIKSHLSAIIVGLAGDQTRARARLAARSGANRSAIHALQM